MPSSPKIKKEDMLQAALDFPLFCPKCKKSFIINVKDHIVDYQSIARR